MSVCENAEKYETIWFAHLIHGVHIEHTVHLEPAALLSVQGASALPDAALTEVEHNQHDDQHNAQHSSAN